MNVRDASGSMYWARCNKLRARTVCAYFNVIQVRSSVDLGCHLSLPALVQAIFRTGGAVVLDRSYRIFFSKSAAFAADVRTLCPMHPPVAAYI